jgi:hypothetical protein
MTAMHDKARISWASMPIGMVARTPASRIAANRTNARNRHAISRLQGTASYAPNTRDKLFLENYPLTAIAFLDDLTQRHRAFGADGALKIGRKFRAAATCDP